MWKKTEPLEKTKIKMKTISLKIKVCFGFWCVFAALHIHITEEAEVVPIKSHLGLHLYKLCLNENIKHMI